MGVMIGSVHTISVLCLLRLRLRLGLAKDGHAVISPSILSQVRRVGAGFSTEMRSIEGKRRVKLNTN